MQLQRIDELFRSEHSFIEPDDQVYFLREYTAGAGYTHGETNQIVSNIKKTVDRRGRPEWRYKEQAIQQAAQELRAAIGEQALRDTAGRVTFVPMPPSLTRSNPLHDDRVLRILHAMTAGLGCDVRELVLQSRDMPAAHRSGGGPRPRPDDWFSVYYVDEDLAVPPPSTIIVLDDVLTAGAHFAGIKRRLRTRFQGVDVRGCFYARRAVQQTLPE